MQHLKCSHWFIFCYYMVSAIVTKDIEFCVFFHIVQIGLWCSRLAAKETEKCLLHTAGRYHNNTDSNNKSHLTKQEQEQASTVTFLRLESFSQMKGD